MKTVKVVAAIIIHKTQEQADAERREASAAFEKFNAARRQIAESLAEQPEKSRITSAGEHFPS